MHTLHILIANHIAIRMIELVNSAQQHAALGRLMMLASSNLPIGSYTYSQGIESAIEACLINDEASMLAFMQDYLELALLGYELPLLALIVQALANEDDNLANALGADYHASRESKEFLYESDQLALSLAAWLDEVLELDVPDPLIAQGFLPVFATIHAHWQLSPAQAMTTYGFGQIENMVLAAVKTVPLGQMAGQRIIWQLQQALSVGITHISHKIEAVYQNFHQGDIDGNVDSADRRPALSRLYSQLNMSANLPNLALLSCQHERQYSRLFRS